MGVGRAASAHVNVQESEQHDLCDPKPHIVHGIELHRGPARGERADPKVTDQEPHQRRLQLDGCPYAPDRFQHGAKPAQAEAAERPLHLQARAENSFTNTVPRQVRQDALCRLCAVCQRVCCDARRMLEKHQ